MPRNTAYLAHHGIADSPWQRRHDIAAKTSRAAKFPGLNNDWFVNLQEAVYQIPKGIGRTELSRTPRVRLVLRGGAAGPRCYIRQKTQVNSWSRATTGAVVCAGAVRLVLPLLRVTPKSRPTCRYRRPRHCRSHSGYRSSRHYIQPAPCILDEVRRPQISTPHNAGC